GRCPTRVGDAMNRRTLLRWGLAAGGVGIFGVGWPLGQTMLAPTDPGRLLRSQTALPTPYRSILPIPTRLSPVASNATTDFYAITQRVADLAIIPGLTTRAWTYDGTFPGPTIVSSAGRRTVIRRHNALPVPVSVHLHGGHTPPDSDGYPLDLITPPASGAPMGNDGMQSDMSRNSVVGQRDYVYPLQQR